jgi:preprotein translocase subunit SecY
MPYISASIIVQLLATMYGPWQQLKKEGEQGRKKLNQYTRYGTVALAMFQAYGIAMSIQGGGLAHTRAVLRRLLRHHAGRRHDVPDVAGRTDHGARHRQRHLADHLRRHRGRDPGRAGAVLRQGRTGALSTPVILGVIVMVVAVIAFVVFMERALRKIHIQYPRRQVGMKVYEGGSSHLPIKVNPAGVIPAIFASSLLLLPTTIGTFSGGATNPVMSTGCGLPGLWPAAAPGVPGGDDRVLRLLLHPERVVQGR